MSDSLQPHELRQTRPPCPSPNPGVHSNSRPSSWWCHPAISPSVVPFSSCPQSLPASGSFPMSQLFAWGGQSTGVSALASFLPKKSQGLMGIETIKLKELSEYSSLSILVWVSESKWILTLLPSSSYYLRHIWKKKSESEVSQSYLTLCDPMNCSPPSSSVPGIFQARILEWGAISVSRRSSLPRDWTWVSCIVDRRIIVSATREVH